MSRMLVGAPKEIVVEPDFSVRIGAFEPDEDFPVLPFRGRREGLVMPTASHVEETVAFLSLLVLFSRFEL
jgi:hypothetical protein